ncbi:hypothetical protein OIDMADRAFT_29164 [Oidiodendron maius Zn]|uniref:Uncharacterized protein n=1 Tax=Oidiodendron maius (strain Zn) TaxID=913774 RepID=A0A0C3HE99_OIDMZ|nr:hypothetical protein OIDMADRAFT_29164 [Oidiodendron maius Zn]
MGDGFGMCLRSGLLGTVERARSRARENGGGGGGRGKGGGGGRWKPADEQFPRAARVRTKEPIYRDGRARVHQGGGRAAVGEISCGVGGIEPAGSVDEMLVLGFGLGCGSVERCWTGSREAEVLSVDTCLLDSPPQRRNRWSLWHLLDSKEYEMRHGGIADALATARAMLSSHLRLMALTARVGAPRDDLHTRTALYSARNAVGPLPCQASSSFSRPRRCSPHPWRMLSPPSGEPEAGAGAASGLDLAIPRNQSLGRVVLSGLPPPASVDATIVAFYAQWSGSRAASAQPPSQRRRVPSADDGALRDVKGHEGAGKASTRAVGKHRGPRESSREVELDTLLRRAQQRVEERVEERERERNPPALAPLVLGRPRPTWFPPPCRENQSPPLSCVFSFHEQGHEQGLRSLHSLARTRQPE